MCLDLEEEVSVTTVMGTVFTGT